MEETELEEGEATYDYGTNDDMDPDIAYSYLDGKIQDVLGHFQKDFEGGVSAENLGAKFGGYGSFLPTYQRSPSISTHPKTPKKIQNHCRARSPNPPSEGVDENSTLQSAVHDIASKLTPAHVITADILDKTMEISSKCDILDMSVNARVQKPLKFRIKMGKDNVSCKRNAEIYSGLGLDVSPSSSMDSLDSDGILSPDFEDIPDVSPTAVLQIMTSFAVPGGFMLSPLLNNMLQLKEKLYVKNNKSFSIQKTYGMLVDKSVSPKDSKRQGQRETIYAIESDTIKEKYGETGNADNEITSFLEKEIDIETPEGKEIVSNALNLLPILSSSTSINGTADLSSNISKDHVNHLPRESMILPDFVNGEALGLADGQESHNLNNNESVYLHFKDKPSSKTSLPMKTKEDRRNKPHKDISSVLKDVDNGNDNKEQTKDHFDRVKETKHQPKVTPKDNSYQSAEEEQIPGIFCCNDSLDTHFLKEHNDKKQHVKTMNNHPVNKSDDSKVHEPPTKITREVCSAGSLGLDANNIIESTDTYRLIKDNNIEPKVEREKETYGLPREKENPFSKKKLNPSTSGIPEKESVMIPLVNGQSVTVPSLPLDNWVHCDLCHKRRLLPYETNPNQLPQMWHCSKLDWLPGMNDCNIDEELTTRALREKYQFSLAGSQNTLRGFVDCLSQEGTRKRQDDSPGKISNNFFSVLQKRNLEAFGKSEDISETNRHPLESNSVDKTGYPHETKSFHLDKDKGIDKQKHKSQAHSQIEGEYIGYNCKPLKDKSKRDVDQDGSKAYKRSKKEHVHSTGQYWDRDNDISGKSVQEVGDIVPTGVTGECMKKSDDKSFRGTEENSQSPLKDSKDQCEPFLNGYEKPHLEHSKIVEVNVLSHMKRKVKESKEENSQHKQEKKIKVSKIEGKEKIADKYILKNKKKTQSTKTSVSDTSQIKMDLVYSQSLAAATSSSSKVSGCHKATDKFLDAKDFPVESVSSSPQKVCKNADVKGSVVEGDGNSSIKEKPSCIAIHGCIDPQRVQGSAEPGIHRNKDTDKVDDRPPKAKNLSKICDANSDPLHSLVGTSSLCNGQEFLHESRRGDNGSRRRDIQSYDDKGKMKISDLVSGLPSSTDPVKNRSFQKDIAKKQEVEKENQIKSFANESQDIDSEVKGVKSSASCEKDLRFNEGKRFLNSLHLNEHNQVDIPSRKVKSQMPPLSVQIIHDQSSQENLVINCKDKSQTFLMEPTKLKDKSQAFLMEPTKLNTQSALQYTNLLPSLSKGELGKDTDVQVHSKKGRNQAAFVSIKEAKDLKHSADRLKGSGQELESTRLYFEAALKFLRGASLLEIQITENDKLLETIAPLQVYVDTAKLCEYCALDYERCKEMAFAALAYKCVEVAYMRVVYSKYSSTNKDRHELQKTFQATTRGESPSSSASDIDNLNNQVMLEKTTLSRSITSQPTANQVIASQNHSGFVRLLDFTQYVHCAMEALRKAHNAFASVNTSSGRHYEEDGTFSVRRVLDFNFHDVEGLLRLVRVAMETIG